MAYVPDWERLSDALKRVMAACVSEDQAKLDISRAIADRKIRARLTFVIEPDALVNWHRMVQNAQGLGLPPMWTRLADVLARVTAIGVDEAQAKRNICRAIADRRVKIRFRVASEEGPGSFGDHVAGSVRRGDEVEIPTDLDSNDFDWQQSRPLKPWRDARQLHCARASSRHIEWIELLIERGDEATECFEGASIKVPPHLTPGTFDWENSRPLNPWPVRPRGGRPDDWRSFSRPAVLIELSVSDIRNALCDGDQPNDKAEQPNATAGQESIAIKALASQLQNNPDLKREDAAEWCREKGYILSDRGFRNRVWPQARAKADLPTKGSAGRKRKSAR